MRDLSSPGSAVAAELQSKTDISHFSLCKLTTTFLQTSYKAKNGIWFFEKFESLMWKIYKMLYSNCFIGFLIGPWPLFHVKCYVAAGWTKLVRILIWFPTGRPWTLTVRPWTLSSMPCRGEEATSEAWNPCPCPPHQDQTSRTWAEYWRAPTFPELCPTATCLTVQTTLPHLPITRLQVSPPSHRFTNLTSSWSGLLHPAWELF